MERNGRGGEEEGKGRLMWKSFPSPSGLIREARAKPADKPQKLLARRQKI